MAVEPVDGNGVELPRNQATCRDITKHIINASRVVAMDQSDDLIKDFIGHFVKWRERLLLLLVQPVQLQLLPLQHRRRWRCQELLLIWERRGE